MSMAFLYEALLMGLHKKHAPMDVLVHTLLTCSMLACAAFSAAEAAWRDVPLLTAGRIAGMYLQGAWFLAAARVMYEGRSEFIRPSCCCCSHCSLHMPCRSSSVGHHA